MQIIEFLLSIILNPFFIISLIFWLIVIALVFILKNKKESIYVFFPLIALLKTKKLNNFIRKIANKIPRFWKIFWTIGIFVSFGFMIMAFYVFFINMINLITQPKVEYTVQPLIPGVTVDLPLFAYLIIPILFVITTHELAHGISASVDGVDVKSTGILGAGLFYIIAFGAFVEVDEKELYSSKYSRNTRLRIAAAGTYINGIMAFITLLIIILFPLLISPVYGAQVVQVDTVLKKEEGGFNYGNLDKNDVIVALKKNGTNQDFINIDGSKGITLSAILNNKTEGYEFSVGDNLILKVYLPDKDKYTEKEIILGPSYNIGFSYEYISNSEIKITHIYSKEEGGNNYDKNLKENLIITEINGTKIDQKNGNTLEKILTNFNLKNLILKSEDGKEYLIDVEINGVLIGILSRSYWLPKNDVGKFFTGNLPSFILIELYWLWIISISITLFNMLPLPIFDGDRMVKEVINSIVGEQYSEKRKKKEILLFEKDKKEYDLSEYRIERIISVKLNMSHNVKTNEKSEIIINEQFYSLIDKIGDGFNSTLLINLPETAKIEKETHLIVEYEYWYDTKRPLKKAALNSIRMVALFIILINFILSFIVLGYF
ncbi:MAG: site-2 protease family protein [Promethearchaeota archaeon]